MSKSKGIRKPCLPPPSKEEVDKVAVLYKSGASLLEIVEQLGFNYSRVRTALKISGTPFRSISVGIRSAIKKGRMLSWFAVLKREDHPQWKGGRRISNPGGYWEVNKPNHARARSAGYVFEHILIWEAIYGPILKGMEIHHINGDKLDNRLENLRLLSASEHRKLERSIARARTQTMLQAGYSRERLTNFGYLKKEKRGMKVG